MLLSNTTLGPVDCYSHRALAEMLPACAAGQSQHSHASVFLYFAGKRPLPLAMLLLHRPAAFLEQFFLRRHIPSNLQEFPSIWQHMLSWWPRRTDPNVLWLFFEDLKDQPQQVCGHACFSLSH